MAGWMLVALWTSANSIAPQPATFNHVRSDESRIRTLVAEGYAHSPTFRTLVDTVEGLSCVVYVSTIVKLSGGKRGALLHRAAGRTEMPVLRVLLKTNLAPDEAIAVIGHELQHVVETMREADAAGRFDPAAASAKRSSSSRADSRDRSDTEQAIAVTARVLDELKKNRSRRL